LSAADTELLVVVVAEAAATDDNGFAFAFFLFDLGGFLGMTKEETTRFWRINNRAAIKLTEHQVHEQVLIEEDLVGATGQS